MAMAAKVIRDITKAVQGHFITAQTPLSLPPETRLLVQKALDEYDGKSSEEEAARAHLELKSFYEKNVSNSPQKVDLFMSVLKDIEASIVGQTKIGYWAEKAAAVIKSADHSKAALEDAQHFLLGVMVYDDEEADAGQRARISQSLRKDFMETYISRSSTLTDTESLDAQENARVAQQVEDMLVAFGRKRPKELFNSIDDFVVPAITRLQALTLLNSFLRHPAPHLYLVMNTPLVEHLLKCLMNDTSTATLSVAMTSLIMLLPHIAGSLAPFLPRLFLAYSRILCWEKFSELSTEADKSLVTDNRVSRADADDDSDDDAQDIGSDLKWEISRPRSGIIEAATPELMTYFTYLYGLYPLNLMSYIRKPRRYLKNVEFPGADAFDLDQAVIRSRTEQFRQSHFIHPNFYNMTTEEELTDTKWAKMEPADVVGSCQALCVYMKPGSPSMVPRPVANVANIPPMSPLTSSVRPRMRGQVSPAASHTSLRSGTSWLDTQSTAASVPANGASPISKAQSVFSDDDRRPQQAAEMERSEPTPQTNLEYLQSQITSLRSDLNFERWHKAQYSEHISQIMRRNVKEATVEAETLNLINANRALKKQLEQLQKAREATIKDSALTRKQASSLETNMTERFNKLKLEQETWQADADELRRLRTEMKQYRELLVNSESRELNQKNQLEVAKQNLEEMDKLKDQLQHASKRLHEFEDRQFEFQTAVRERDILRRRNESLIARLESSDDTRGTPPGRGQACVSTESTKRRGSAPMGLEMGAMLRVQSRTDVPAANRDLRSNTAVSQRPSTADAAPSSKLTAKDALKVQAKDEKKTGRLRGLSNLL